MLPLGENVVKVLVTFFNTEMLQEPLELVSELRRSGLRCQLHCDSDPLGTQIRCALKKDSARVIVLGPDEPAADQLTVRHLAANPQATVERARAAQCMRGLLDRRE